MAEEMALFQSGVIQIAQVDRFLHLIYIVAGKKNQGHLGLDQFYLLWFVGIGPRLKEGADCEW